MKKFDPTNFERPDFNDWAEEFRVSQAYREPLPYKGYHYRYVPKNQKKSFLERIKEFLKEIY